MRMLEAQVASAAPFKSESKLSSEQLFERALGTVIAVDETSRHLFVALLGAIASAPHVRSRLEEEQRQAIREHGDDLSHSVLNNMPYLDAVVKETLRLFPASIGGFRVARRDVQVSGESGTAIIPAGSVVYWSTHLQHATDPALLPRTPAPEPPSLLASVLGSAAAAPRGKAAAASTAGAGTRPGGLDTAAGRSTLARSWVGPTGLPAHMDYEARFEEAFRPERWLSEETRPRQFAGFGGGSHMCLGQHVAMAEAKLLASLLLRRFDFRLEEPAMLRQCSAFPGLKPRKGTDGMLLLPRKLTA